MKVPYYKWERVYLSEVSRQLAVPEQLPGARASQIVRVDPSQLPEEMEVIGGVPATKATLEVCGGAGLQVLQPSIQAGKRLE